MSNIWNVDVKELKDYVGWINHQYSIHQTKKRRLDDAVDMGNRLMTTKSKTIGFSSSSLYLSSYLQWNSSNALQLFNPTALRICDRLLGTEGGIIARGYIWWWYFLTFVININYIKELSS